MTGHNPALSFHFRLDTSSQLIQPIADISITSASAPNNDGDLQEAIYAIGGCVAQYRPTVTALPSSPNGPDDNTQQQQQQPQQHEYYCPQISNKNYAYIPQYAEFEERAPMPHARHHHTSTSTINGLIWVCGGRDEHDQIVTEVDVYDTIMDRWTTLDMGLEQIIIPPIAPSSENSNDAGTTYKVSHHAAFAANGGVHLVLTGGFTQDYIAVGYTIAINTVSSIEQNRLIYTVNAPLTIPRGDATAIMYHASRGSGNDGHGYALVIGGMTHMDGYCEAMSSVEMYDPVRHQWILLPNKLNEGRANANFFHLYETIGRRQHKYLVAFGGEHRGVYDSDTGLCHDRSSSRMPWKKWGNKEKYAHDCVASSSLLLEENQMLPRRLTCPVRSIEVLEMTDDSSQLDTVPWTVLKGGGVPDNLMYRYAIIPWPSMDSIFIFGGVRQTSKSAIITTRARRRMMEKGDGNGNSTTSCFGNDDGDNAGGECLLHLSDGIYVNSPERINSDSMPLIAVTLGILSFLLVMLVGGMHWYKKRRIRKQVEMSRGTIVETELT